MITEQELAVLIQQAFDMFSDVQVDPAVARAQQAQMIAAAISQYVIGRVVLVTGVQPGGGTAPGTVTE